MATYVQRAVALTEALKDATLTAEQQSRVAEAFAKHYPEHFSPADPQNPTNAEYAECLIESQRAHFKDILRVHAETDARQANEPNVTAAGDTAASDIE